MKSRRSSIFAPLILCAAALFSRAGSAGEGTIAVGEIAAPPPAAGVDSAALRASAEGEIRRIDVSKLPARRVVVSLAVVQATDAPIACTVSATLRDHKTGNLLAILEGRAAADGGGNTDLKQRVAQAAVRSAVRQIPVALAR